MGGSVPVFKFERLQLTPTLALGARGQDARRSIPSSMSQRILCFLFGIVVCAPACDPRTTRPPEAAEPASRQVPAPPAMLTAHSDGRAEPPDAGEATSRPQGPAPTEPEPAEPVESPVDDPRLLERLTISVPEPRALGEAKFRAAREVFREVKRHVTDGSFVEQKDPRCQQALVTEQQGLVRG